MQSTVSSRGQTAIPAAIRKKLGIKASTKLEWIAEDGSARVIPLPRDPIEALRGCLKGSGLLQLLIESRRQEREREDRD